MSRTYIACQLGGWGGWALVYGLISAAYVPHTPAALLLLFVSYGLNVVYGILISHWLLYRGLARSGWMQLPMPRFLLRIVPAVLAGAFITASALVLINDRLLHIMGGRIGIKEFFYFSTNFTLLLSVWTIIYALLHLAQGRRTAERQRAALEVAMREAQFRSLAAQVQPHFFFNALNTIRALIYENPAEADRALTVLAGLLRAGLQNEGRPEIPLHEELQIVEDYLSLERLRFEDRLQVVIRSDTEAGSLLVPRMSLQHLVENALKHGIAHLPAGGEVHIGVHVHDDLLRITVRNPCAHPATLPATSPDHGLANTRERLRLLYGTAATLELRPDAGGMTASMVVPCHRKDAHAHAPN